MLQKYYKCQYVTTNYSITAFQQKVGKNKKRGTPHEQITLNDLHILTQDMQS